MTADLSVHVWAQAQEVIDSIIAGSEPSPVVISEFTLFSTADDCKTSDAIGSVSFVKGHDSKKCHSVGELTGGKVAFGISETGGDLKCQCEF